MPVEAGTGANPKLPPPKQRLIPTVEVAHAIGWPEGGKPVAAEGLKVERFASGLVHPRWLYVLPNGDVLVAETNAPAAARRRALRGVDHEAGRWEGAGARRAERQPHHAAARRRRRRRRRDEDRSFLDQAELAVRHGAGRRRPLRRQHRRGAALPLQTGETTHHRARHARSSTCRPAPINHHWTKNVIASPDGSKLYRRRRLEQQRRRERHGRPKEAAPRSGRSISRRARSRLSPPACAIRTAWPCEPESGALWIAVNERDELGSDLVPDYMTSVKDGGFYGWPYSYYGQHRRSAREAAAARSRRQGDRARTTRSARTPPRSGSPSTTAQLLPERYRGGAFVGQHGSWNRDPPSGYKVIFVPFADGQPSGSAGGRADRLPQRRRRCARTPGRRRGRQDWRAARRRRRRQHGLAGDAGAPASAAIEP